MYILREFFKKNKKGMTLIELLAVIAIIAILFVLLIPAVSSGIDKSRLSGLKTDFHSYQIGLKSYLMENAEVEKSGNGLNTYLDKSLQFESGISKKKNPWGEHYKLNVTEDKETFKITTENKKKGKEYTLSANIDEEGEIVLTSSLDLDKTSNSIDNSETTNTTGTEDNLTITSGFWKYTEKNGAAEIVGYEGTNTSVVVPTELNGKPVTSIKSGAFNGTSLSKVLFPTALNSLSNIYLGNGIVSETISVLNPLNTYATEVLETKCTNIEPTQNSSSDFKTTSYNSGLAITDYIGTSKNVVIPCKIGGLNVLSLASNSFKSKGLTSVVLPETLVNIDSSAFFGNSLTHLVIPEGVTTINSSAFSGTLDHLVLPDSVKKITNSALQGLNLKALYIGKGLTSYSGSALGGNPDLKVFVSEENPNFKNDSINSAIYSKDGKSLIFGTQATLGTSWYNVVEEIAYAAFRYQKISSVTLPPNLKVIGNSAFDQNYLTTITIPASVIEVEYMPFANNPNLKTVIDKSGLINSSHFSSSPTITN